MICRACQFSGEIEEFVKDRARPSGHKPICKACDRARARAYAKKNKAIRNAKSRKWAIDNEAYRKEWGRSYRAANREKLALVNKEWRAKNRSWARAASTARKSAVKKATPSWMDSLDNAQIASFYMLAQASRNATKQDFHVDHIMPIKGENSCGLHVPWNLQVLPALDNMSKKNKLPLAEDHLAPTKIGAVMELLSDGSCYLSSEIVASVGFGSYERGTIILDEFVRLTRLEAKPSP